MSMQHGVHASRAAYPQAHGRRARAQEGMAFARNAFGGDADAAPDHHAVASAVFSSPPIATVGLTENQAVEKYGDVDVYSSSFRRAPFTRDPGRRPEQRRVQCGVCPQRRAGRPS